MATYYVRTNGNDANSGTGPATNQAWQTITKAIGATGIAPGDTLYIAPGVYRGAFSAAFTNPTSEGQRITIAGDPRCQYFTDITPNAVIITNYDTNTTSLTGQALSVIKNFITLKDLYFFGSTNTTTFTLATMQTAALIMDNICSIPVETTSESGGFRVYVPDGAAGATVRRCIFFGQNLFRGGNTSSYNSNTLIQDCIFSTTTTSSQINAPLTIGNFPSGTFGGITIANCSFFSSLNCLSYYQGTTLSTTHPMTIKNCYFQGTFGIVSSSTSAQTESYNIFNCGTASVNVTTGTGRVSKPFNPLDLSMSKVQGWGNLGFYSPLSVSYAVSYGTTGNTLTSDIYSNAWLNQSTPTVGAVENASISAGGLLTHPGMTGGIRG